MTQRCEEMLHPVMPVSPQAGGACRGTADCAAALADALAGRTIATVDVLHPRPVRRHPGGADERDGVRAHPPTKQKCGERREDTREECTRVLVQHGLPGGSVAGEPLRPSALAHRSHARVDPTSAAPRVRRGASVRA